jgi:hypothetical protein
MPAGECLFSLCSIRQTFNVSMSKIILQILHQCCSIFLEVDAHADIGVLYVASIVKVCEYVVVSYEANG